MTDQISNELASGILAGEIAWSAVCKKYPADRSIYSFDFDDVKIANIRIERTIFSGCKFDLAGISSVDFIDCTFLDCTITRSKFDRTNFLNCNISGSEIRGTSFVDLSVTRGKLSATPVRNSNFQDAKIFEFFIEKSDISGLVGQSIELMKCSLNEVAIHIKKLPRLLLSGCKVTEVKFSADDCNALTIEGCIIERPRFVDLVVQSLRITDCSVTETTAQNCQIESIDLSGSRLSNCDLNQLPIEHAILNRTALIDCVWPPQIGRIDRLGRFRKADRLISYPVEEIERIDREFSSVIAQQQALAAVSEISKGSWLGKAAFWVWGITTNFGRSLSRFGGFCVMLVILFATMQTINCQSWDGMSVAGLVAEFLVALGDKVQIFLGLTSGENLLQNACRHSYDLPTRLSGFLCMGLWIGVAANRLGFLNFVRR